MKKAATPKSNSLVLHTNESKAKRPPYKTEETLICLLQRGARGLIQPEAHKVYGDSCLHTVISILRNNHNILVIGEAEPPRKYRKPYTRYRLADDKAENLALCLLNNLRRRRNMAPISYGHYQSLTNRAA
tara:strand:+ start:3702 stop:4091 length:390 start_codon:yes stop_codon:yes gene_type:complete